MMIKLGEKRINIQNVAIYLPDDSDASADGPFYIRFDFTDRSQEKIKFKTVEARDAMLKMLDNHLVFFDNGVIRSSEGKSMPSFIIDDSNIGGSGPGGVPMQ